MKIGVFGGTFDPVHTGHLIVAEAAMEQLGLQEILFVPAGEPQLRKFRPEATANQRLLMAELATADNPSFRVIDNEIKRQGPTYTVDTLEELHRGKCPEDELYFLAGIDALQNIGRWQRPARLFELAKVVALARQGYGQQQARETLEVTWEGGGRQIQVLANPLINISSTEVRERIAKGRTVNYLLPEPVKRHIYLSGFYEAAQRTEEEASYAKEILELAKNSGALRFGKFQLSAGGTSPYYFDGRLITLDPKGASLVAKSFLPILRRYGAEIIAGPTVGADPIVSSVVLRSGEEGLPISGLIVRMKTKQHGVGRLIEGPVKAGARVAVVDDTCSTGASLIHSIDAVEQAGYHVVVVLSILDRQQGGADTIRLKGHNFVALLEADHSGEIRPARYFKGKG